VSAIVDLVDGGYGFSVVPKNVLRTELGLKKSSWQRLDVPTLNTALCLATSARRPESRLARETVALLRGLIVQTLRTREPASRSRRTGTRV